MARLFDDALSQYYSSVTIPVLEAPLTMACWSYLDTDGVNCAAMSIGDLSAFVFFGLFALGGVAGDPVRCQTSPGGQSDKSGHTFNEWNHIGAVFAGIASRTAWLQGEAGTTDTSSGTPTNLDEFAIGRRANSSSKFYWTGRLAEAGVWKIALSDDEMIRLGPQYRHSPLRVRPEHLVAYHSLAGPTVNNDWQFNLGSAPLLDHSLHMATNGGAILHSSHPPSIIYPEPDRIELRTLTGFTVTLPTAVGVGGQAVAVKNVTDSLHTVMVETILGQTIDGQPFKVVNTVRGRAIFVSDNANWMQMEG